MKWASTTLFGAGADFDVGVGGWAHAGLLLTPL